jgi:TP901 family phage tail tape measure protein
MAIADFSKEVANLRATLNGTPQEMATNMAALREQAKLVGSSTSFSLAEVAKAQRVLAQAGLEAQDILRATPDVLKFAQAGDFKNL